MAFLRIKRREDAGHKTKVLKNIAVIIIIGVLASASVSQDDIIGNIFNLAMEEPIIAIIILAILISYAAFHTLTFELNLRIKKKQQEKRDNDN